MTRRDSRTTRSTDPSWLLALMLATGTAWAQAPAATTAPNPGTARPAASAASGTDQVQVVQLAREDAAFLMQAAQNGLAEVEASKLALSRATMPEVKQFAQRMVDDHTKAHAELAALAKSKGMKLPTEPSLMQRGTLKALGTREGASFDAQYAEGMGVEAHNDTVKLFAEAARDSKDAQIKAWAAKTLPTLQQHLAMANQLHTTTKAAAGRSSSAPASPASSVGATGTSTPSGAATGTPRP